MNRSAFLSVKSRMDGLYQHSRQIHIMRKPSFFTCYSTQNALLFSRCFFNIVFKNVDVFDFTFAVIRYAPVSLRRLCYKLFLLHPAPSGYPIFQLPLLQFRVERFTLSESGTHALYGKRTVCKEQPREMLV